MTSKSRKTAKKLHDPNKKVPGKPFMIGYDPRRNLKGVPKTAIKGREMIRKIGAELVRVSEKVITADGQAVEIAYDITRLEGMVRLMYTSKAPQDKQTLLKALFPGLVVDELELNKKEPIILKVVYDDKRVQNPSADPPRQTSGLSDSSGKEKDSPGGAQVGED